MEQGRQPSLNFCLDESFGSEIFSPAGSERMNIIGMSWLKYDNDTLRLHLSEMSSAYILLLRKCRTTGSIESSRSFRQISKDNVFEALLVLMIRDDPNLIILPEKQ